MPKLPTLPEGFIPWLMNLQLLHVSWSSDCQGSVQIGSLKTLWHDHIARIDDTACPGRKTPFWLMSMRWTVKLAFKTTVHIETVPCRLLLRMARMNMDWKIQKLGPPFTRFHAVLSKMTKIIMVILPNEICLIPSSSSSSVDWSILCVGRRR